ncbi:MAG TPA: hypothetical protein PKY25_02050 [Bacilli bacterium]|nr:hypothetical protein [Bacilli bacterium]
MIVKIKNIKKMFQFSKKALFLVTALCIGLSVFNISKVTTIFAEEPIQEITITDGVANGNYIEYYNGETLMGKVQIKIGDTVLVPNGNKVVLPAYNEPYQVGFYLTYEEGYEATGYVVNGQDFMTPGGGETIYVSITSGDSISVRFNFSAINNNPGPGEGPIPSNINYPILAYFENIESPIESNSNNQILMPNNWTTGTVSFKAKICEVDGELAPNDGESVCDVGTESLSDLDIEGISNRDQINQTVSSNEAQNSIIIDSGFSDYGKVGIHLTNDILNITTDVISNNLINIEASAPMRMDYSYGLETIDQTIVTSSTSGAVSIFFGNNEATLIATGPNVLGITNLTGAPHTLNDEDKSVNVTLPDLSVETETPVTITIELLDHSTVTRQINIIRTAIELSYDGEHNRVNAGYVMHKAYLYNNQNHSDTIFDAYLQVILYSNNKVIGYKQIEIDDESIINGLEENGSGSIESIGPEPIVVYDGTIQGVNKVSVFLTNGPIDYNSNALPSIEFGLGAGVQFLLGGN